MLQLGVPTAQTHRPEPARKSPEALQFGLLRLVGNKRGDSRHGDPDRRHRKLEKPEQTRHLRPVMSLLTNSRSFKKTTTALFMREAHEMFPPHLLSYRQQHLLHRGAGLRHHPHLSEDAIPVKKHGLLPPKAQQRRVTTTTNNYQTIIQ